MGPKLDGKIGVIEGFELMLGSESGVMCKVSFYEGMLDSNWLDVVI